MVDPITGSQPVTTYRETINKLIVPVVAVLPTAGQSYEGMEVDWLSSSHTTPMRMRRRGSNWEFRGGNPIVRGAETFDQTYASGTTTDLSNDSVPGSDGIWNMRGEVLVQGLLSGANATLYLGSDSFMPPVRLIDVAYGTVSSGQQRIHGSTQGTLGDLAYMQVAANGGSVRVRPFRLELTPIQIPVAS